MRDKPLIFNHYFFSFIPAYEYVHNNTAASESYRLAHLWKESLSCATFIPLSLSELQSLARGLAEAQIESKDFFSAAIIHLEYLTDVSAATRLFCQGYHFAEAIRIATLHQRSDLLASTIDIGLVEGMASTTELLADCKTQLGAQVPRIHELRIKKAEDPLAFLESGDGPGSGAGDNIPDNISLAPTDDASTAGGGTLFTRYTNRTGMTTATRTTSKNRRREERKRARGKKGSVYEEEYLINSVARLVQKVNGVSDEVGRLVVGLMRRGMRERARAVDVAMGELVALCRSAIVDVFIDFDNGSKQNGDIDGEEGGNKEGKIAAEAAAAAWTFSSAHLSSLPGSNSSPEIPLVKTFERLSLLGS